MRMRIALSALVAAITLAAAVGGNVTAASAETSSLYSNQDYSHCC
jgi:ABC-type glycerol-3-phosphate transport system substrate-binding protein